ncbi:MAG: hypothetical protein ACFFAX_13760 [Promethearchaeota archaeon]
MNEGTPHVSSQQSILMTTPQAATKTRQPWKLKLILVAWMAALGIDFLWHGGFLSEIYTQPNPALLDPMQAFLRIPFGYGALLIQVVLFYWFFSLTGVDEWRKGLKIGFIFGSLAGIASILGQYSILALELGLLILWGVGQLIEVTAMGAVLGAGISAASLRSLGKRVTALVLIAVLFTIIMQNAVHWIE